MSRMVELAEGDEDAMDPKEAAEMIARHVNRIIALAPTAGLYVGIKIEPARKPSPNNSPVETDGGGV